MVSEIWNNSSYLIVESVSKNVEFFKQSIGASKFRNISCNFVDGTGLRKVHVFKSRKLSFEPERVQVILCNEWVSKNIIVFKWFIQALKIWFISSNFIDGSRLQKVLAKGADGNRLQKVFLSKLVELKKFILFQVIS